MIINETGKLNSWEGGGALPNIFFQSSLLFEIYRYVVFSVLKKVVKKATNKNFRHRTHKNNQNEIYGLTY